MVTIDGTIGHWSPPLVGRLTTIGHTFHLLQSLVIARLHVPPIVASDCKWRSCEASPFGRATSRNSVWLVELLIVRLFDTQSRTTGGATTHELWCDHTRLVVRPCKTCLRLVIADSFEHDRQLILLVRPLSVARSLYDLTAIPTCFDRRRFGVTVSIVNMKKVYNLEQKINHNWQ